MHLICSVLTFAHENGNCFSFWLFFLKLPYGSIHFERFNRLFPFALRFKPLQTVYPPKKRQQPMSIVVPSKLQERETVWEPLPPNHGTPKMGGGVLFSPPKRGGFWFARKNSAEKTTANSKKTTHMGGCPVTRSSKSH